MSGELENGEKNNRESRITAVHNSWVICNSKSRPGLKYYFNTLTGQAVWNLSPFEIEKAQKYTKAIPISEIEKCPEPNTDPPMDYPEEPPHNTQSRVFNEKIVKNQYPNQIPNRFPLNMLNGMPGVSDYNPYVWSNPPNDTVPPLQVLLVACKPSMNFQPTQEYLQYLPPTQYQNNIFDTQKYSKDANSKVNKMFNRGNSMSNRRNILNNNLSKSRFSQNLHLNRNWNFNSSDLRQKLRRKRSKSLSCEPDIKQDAPYRFAYHEYVGTTTQRNIEETPSKYDLSVLKQFKTPHSKANNWFIVVDTEIILNNFPFLNKITDPDQNCYLMVPYNVMEELRLLASSDSDVHSRRIYRFLSEQIDSELAFKGDDIDTDMTDGADYKKTFATCVETAIRNNVILLSNNIKFNAYKNNRHSVIVLTLNELKLMLNEPKKQVSTRTKSPTLDINIVVHNEKELERNETVSSSLFRPETPNVEVTPHDLKKKEIRIQSDSKHASSEKHTNPQQASGSVKHFNEVNQTKVIDAPEPIGFEKRLENLSIYNSEKKKEIKLCRSYSNQKTNAENNTQTKRQFRWRKQRRTNDQIHLSKPSSVTSDHAVSIDDDKLHEASTYEKPRNLCEVSPKNPISPLQAPSLDRSSISSSHYKRLGPPNVTIEETSTSGVISNTTLDCESVNSDLKKTMSVFEDVNYEIFQVVGQDMEEVLRTRREEWVLRFVQIMEEVLRELLRDDSPSQSKDYALQWATDLPELARCIIKKFSDHFNVVDAANRLSFTLQRISDSKGNLSTNIEPGQYMDMYSFGVYLIESLKSVTMDCEDLNVADESLKKLLHDIEKVSDGGCHNDVFADDLNESAVHQHKFAEELPQLFPDSDSIKATSEQDQNEKQSSYMLRSRKKTPTKISNEPKRISTPQPQLSTHLETTFFTSLELSKRLNTNSAFFVKTLDFQDTLHSTPKINNATQTPPLVTPPEKQSKVEATSIQKTVVNNNEDALSGANDIENITVTGDDKENTSSSGKICFVRNFTSIAQFEKKLLNNQFTDPDEEAEKYVDDSYDAYADVYYDENIVQNDLEDGKIAEFEAEENVVCENGFFFEIEHGKNAEFENEKNAKSENGGEIAEFDNKNNTDFDYEFEEGEIFDNLKLQDPPNSEGNMEHSDINKKHFKCFIMELIGEIKESVEAVQKLCAEFVEDMKNSQDSSPDMVVKLRTACAVMLKISNVLNSILDRESRKPEGNVMLLLKKANLEDFVPNEELRLEYADIVSKCRDQAYKCYKTVTVIMAGAGIKKVA